MTTERKGWLAERTLAIGASESPILFGEGYAGTSVYKLWAQKLGLIPCDDMDDVESIKWGNRLEPVIIQGLREDHGFDVVRATQNEFLRHPDKPHIGCTLDARVFDDSRPTPGTCEIKNVGQYFAREWSSIAPLRVQVQVHHQMAVTGYEWGIAAGLVGGNELRVHVVERDEKFIGKLIAACDKFWHMVSERISPDPDGSEATARTLCQLHPKDNGQSVPLPIDFDGLIAELDQVAASIKQLESRESAIKNRVKAAIGDKTFASLSCGRWASWRTEDVAEHVVAGHSKRVLRFHKSRPDGAVKLDRQPK